MVTVGVDPKRSRMRLVTPKQITNFLEEFQHRFDSPDVYLGTEPNAFHWSEQEWEAARFHGVIFAPFDYLQAIGNSTIPLLYRLANDWDAKTRTMERVYFPTTHSEVKLFERNGIPLWGLESRHALGAYDLIGAPLNYSPYFANIIKGLRMSGIPVRAAERADCREQYPLVVVGGHIFADPWLPAPIADIVWLGEAEDESKEAQAAGPRTITDEKSLHLWFKQHDPIDNPGWNAVLDDLTIYKDKGMLYDAEGREQMLHELAVKYEFLFIPRFYKLNHHKTEKGWRLAGWTKRYEDIPNRPTKRFVRNLDAVPALVAPPVPFHDPGMGLGQVQIARGCTYHCNFCAAAYREAPYRERSRGLMVQHFKDIMTNTGAMEVAPLTLEFGTYSGKKGLMKQLLEEVTGKISMPSLRVDVFAGDPVFGQLAVASQKKNVTIALEGNSQKLREVVSKGITEEDVLKAVSYAIAAGYDSAKLYMIANLPGETAEDMDEIVALCEKIDALRRSAGSMLRVRLSWKPLSVQANLPMQWVKCRDWQTPMGNAMKRIQKLGFGTQLGDEAKSGLGNFIQLAELADDISAEALVDTMIEEDVVTFGAMPQRVFDGLIRNLAKRDRTFEDYYREKDEDELFAWDIVDTQVTKAYLLRHYRKMKRRANDDATLPIYGGGFIEKFGGCQIGCTACGACGSGQDTPMLDAMKEFATRVDEPVRLSEIRFKDFSTVRQRVLLLCKIEDDRRFVTRKHWMYAIRRACNKAGIQLTHTPIPFQTDQVKSTKHWFAGMDYAELSLFQPEVDLEGLPERINGFLDGTGFSITGVQMLSMNEGLKTLGLEAAWWELEIDRPRLEIRGDLDRAVSAEYQAVRYKTNNYRVGEKIEEIALTEVLLDGFVSTRGKKTILALLTRPDFSPYDIAASTLSGREDLYRYPATLKAMLSGVSDKYSNAFTKYCECGKPIPTEFGVRIGATCVGCFYTVNRPLAAHV